MWCTIAKYILMSIEIILPKGNVFYSCHAGILLMFSVTCVTAMWTSTMLEGNIAKSKNMSSTNEQMEK